VNFFVHLTPQTAREALASAGLVCAPGDLQVNRREERWAVLLPGQRIAWFPASGLGASRLAVERRVLSLLAVRCSFAVPRLLWISPCNFDIRHLVPGRCEPWPLFHRCQKDVSLARRIGWSLGTILAEQHASIGETEAAGWLPRRVAWPQTSRWIHERLRHVVDDDGLVRAMEEAIGRYEAVLVDPGDRVLVHGDVGLHNLALDPRSDTVNGIFDYDSAAWADRHHDFRYLLFDVGRDDMLDAAVEAYEPAVGRTLDRNRLRLYNAACAVSYLAFRLGTPSEDKSCGRTLAEDICWVRTALAKLA